MSGQTPEAVYNANIAVLGGIQKSAQEKYDAILTTLASAFLAMSVSFMRDVVPLQGSQFFGLLYASWFGFACTIVATVVSLGLGAKAVAWHVGRMTPHKYPSPDLGKLNPWSKCIGWLNVLSGTAFVTAVVLTVAFVVINTSHWRSAMEKRVPVQGETNQKGLTIPPMQTGVQEPAKEPANNGGQAPEQTPSQSSTTGAN
jgi:hypothetical protein